MVAKIKTMSIDRKYQEFHSSGKRYTVYTHICAHHRCAYMHPLMEIPAPSQLEEPAQKPSKGSRDALVRKLLKRLLIDVMHFLCPHTASTCCACSTCTLRSACEFVVSGDRSEVMYTMHTYIHTSVYTYRHAAIVYQLLW